nr:sugar kinase [Nakamurella panacisegetis]
MLDLRMSDVVTVGETMALMAPETTGALFHTPLLRLGIGGAESNVAIGLQRLGTSAAWVGRVGNDSLGDLIVRELTAEGLRVHAVRDANAPTGLMIKERRTPLNQRVWYYRSGSAGSRLRPGDLPTGLVESSRVLHISGITPALSTSAAGTVAEAVRAARASGTVVSFDVNYRRALWSPETATAACRELAAQADIVFAGEDEAAMLVGPGPAADLARRLADLGAGQVVVKRGEQGCTAVIDDRLYDQPAISVTVVDTVGAGDAFVAGYLHQFLLGADVPTRLLAAVRNAAFVCLSPGDWEGLPRDGDLALLTDAEAVQR